MNHQASFLDPLQRELESLEGQHLRRQLQVIEEFLPGGKVRVGGRELLNLSSNDYLGLAGDARLIEASQAAAAVWGAGSTASRLIVGTLALHQQVEEDVAAFKGTARAVLFNTGYMANVGVIAALMGKGDIILSDKLNHASIIDGMRLSEAAFYRFPHGIPAFPGSLDVCGGGRRPDDRGLSHHQGSVAGSGLADAGRFRPARRW